MASVRRAMKNMKNNFAPCERDVRDATSNDKTLPSAVTMARISNATYDVLTSPMVMTMLWKRLNDTGKNWRHVYKALVLLDYLLKTGAEHIIQEVTLNKFAVQSLLDFMYVNPKGVDKGMNVRAQAKKTLEMIENEPQLREERRKALQEHKRVSEAIGNKAIPKPVSMARAQSFTKKQVVMPNGEVAPNLAEQELAAIRNAQIESFHEYATSAAGQQAVIETQNYDRRLSQMSQGSPNPNRSISSPEHQVQPQQMTDEEALAYALKLSALESEGRDSHPQSPITYQPNSNNQPQPQPVRNTSGSEDVMTPEEEEQLAMALSLSLAESQANHSAILDSDDEPDDEEATPPSTPYQGDFFSQQPENNDDAYSVHSQQIDPSDLPTYEDSLLETSAIPNSSIHDEATAMQSFVSQDDAIGVMDDGPGYMEVLPPGSVDDEEL